MVFSYDTLFLPLLPLVRASITVLSHRIRRKRMCFGGLYVRANAVPVPDSWRNRARCVYRARSSRVLHAVGYSGRRKRNPCCANGPNGVRVRFCATTYITYNRNSSSRLQVTKQRVRTDTMIPHILLRTRRRRSQHGSHLVFGTITGDDDPKKLRAVAFRGTIRDRPFLIILFAIPYVVSTRALWNAPLFRSFFPTQP